ncbi:MAG: serine O-acetyltransferase [Pseudomonadota bacterium]
MAVHSTERVAPAQLDVVADQERPATTAPHDLLWERICQEARAAMEREPAMAEFMSTTVLNRQSLDYAVSFRLAQRLSQHDLSTGMLRDTFDALNAAHPEIGAAMRADLMAVLDRDPACKRLIEPVLYFKGFHAIQTHRLAHALWQEDRRDLAYYLQSQSSRAFAIDIHPATPIGEGLFIDHGHSIVVGETARIGKNVSILQGVTLGGTGKEGGVRHPKIGDGVLIGAGAKVLGNIEIGHCCRIGAGSVVLSDIPPCKTVVGIPARVVGEAGCAEPARSMDQIFADIAAADA